MKLPWTGERKHYRAMCFRVADDPGKSNSGLLLDEVQ